LGNLFYDFDVGQTETSYGLYMQLLVTSEMNVLRVCFVFVAELRPKIRPVSEYKQRYSTQFLDKQQFHATDIKGFRIQTSEETIHTVYNFIF